MALEYVVGDVTRPIGEGQGSHIVAQIVNTEGRYGKGVSGAIARRWPAVEREYRRYWRERQIQTETGYRWRGDRWVYEREPFKLGTAQLIQVAPKPHSLWVANLIAQRGIRRRPTDPVALDYEALEAALDVMAWVAAVPLRATSEPRQPATIHMPRIGAGLAGGDWGRIEQLVVARLVEHSRLTVLVYDLPPA